MKYLVLLFVFVYSQGQNQYDSGIVEYGVEFNQKALEKLENKNIINKYPSDVVQKFKNVIKAHRKFYSADMPFLKLTFNKTAYFLKPIDIMPPEYLKGKFVHKSSDFYYNFKNDLFLKQFKKRGKKYIATLDINYDWQIKKEYKNIVGFKCRKAILKLSKDNQIAAWFAPQIPIAFSPVKYYGLPGAILEITKPDKHIYAMNIEFKKNIKVKKPTEGIKLTAEEYKEMITRFKPD